MTRTTIAGWGCASMLVLLAVAAGYRVLHRESPPAAATPPAVVSSNATSPAVTHPAPQTHQGFLYGRITTAEGAAYEGRLRWGGEEEAFWGDTFVGSKLGNPWVSFVPPELLPEERAPFEIFGIQLGKRETPLTGKPFMARFGDIARIEGRWPRRRLLVTLKSGTAFELDRSASSDFDGGVRVWDAEGGVVDIEGRRIRTIELLPTPRLGDAPYRLQGTVRTRQGDFTGFVRWDRDQYLGADELVGATAGSTLGLRFDTIRSIARGSHDSALVTLLDGREVVLSGIFQVDLSDRGVYVDDERYGRVLISWQAFERVDFTPGGSGPAYDDFPPGHALIGSVTTCAGRRLAGRLVYDLDESETTETLDAPDRGVRYNLPFGRITSIVLPGREGRGAQHATVTLHGGEELRLELSGDLGERNGGMLIFVDGRERPEYVPWAEVELIELGPPPARLSPLRGP